MKNYVVCEGVLGIQTNSNYIGWSFGHPSECVSDEEINKCRVVVRLIVDSLKEESEKMGRLQKYHYWRGEQGRDELFYERNFIAGTKLRMLVKGVKGDRPEMRVNKNFLKYIIE